MRASSKANKYWKSINAQAKGEEAMRLNVTTTRKFITAQQVYQPDHKPVA